MFFLKYLKNTRFGATHQASLFAILDANLQPFQACPCPSGPLQPCGGGIEAFAGDWAEHQRRQWCGCRLDIFMVSNRTIVDLIKTHAYYTSLGWWKRTSHRKIWCTQAFLPKRCVFLQTLCHFNTHCCPMIVHPSQTRTWMETGQMPNMEPYKCMASYQTWLLCPWWTNGCSMFGRCLTHCFMSISPCSLQRKLCQRCSFPEGRGKADRGRDATLNWDNFSRQTGKGVWNHLVDHPS